MMRNYLTSLILFLPLTTTVAAEELFALLELEGKGVFNSLIRFDSATPDMTSTPIGISGLSSGERLLGIDFRPLTGELYGLGSMSALYVIDPDTGTATVVGSGFTDALDGSNFGFDFNPMIDRIRIVSDTGQNFVAHPDTGDANVAATTAVFFAPGDDNETATPNVVHHAYDGNVLGEAATATQLRAIDTELDVLVTQANNAGTLQTIGALGVDATVVGGFDVATSGNAYAAFGFEEDNVVINGDVATGTAGPTSILYAIDLETGAATSLGTINVGDSISVVTALAARPVPEPSSLLLLGLAAVVQLSLCCRYRTARLR